MEKTMYVVSEVQLNELISSIKLLTENLQNLSGSSENKEFYTRKQVAEHYSLSDRAVIKIFTKLLEDKVVNIGKEQKLAKVHIDNLFEQGVTLK